MFTSSYFVPIIFGLSMYLISEYILDILTNNVYKCCYELLGITFAVLLRSALEFEFNASTYSIGISICRNIFITCELSCLSKLCFERPKYNQLEINLVIVVLEILHTISLFEEYRLEYFSFSLLLSIIENFVLLAIVMSYRIYSTSKVEFDHIYNIHSVSFLLWTLFHELLEISLKLESLNFTTGRKLLILMEAVYMVIISLFHARVGRLQSLINQVQNILLLLLLLLFYSHYAFFSILYFHITFFSIHS